MTRYILVKLINFVKNIAFLSAKSLSMIGMYEPKCPEKLKK